MEFYYTILILTTLTLFSTLLITRTRPKTRLNLPPGPPGWPIIGNLFQIAHSGKPFFLYIKDLFPIYGPIITLKMGSQTMIILSQADIIHQALIQQGHVFATRPAENPTRILFSCNKFSVNAAVYGSLWRTLRRNMVQNVLSGSKVRMFRDIRVSAMHKFINRLKVEASENGGVVWVLKNARIAVFDVLLWICFGAEMDEKSILEIDEMLKKVLMTIHPRLDDFLPLLRPFYLREWKRAKQVREEQIALLAPLIESRRDAIYNVKSKVVDSSFAYLDTLFELTVEGRKTPPTTPELVTLCSEFVNGGGDSTSTAIEWAVARLIDNPSIQSRLHDEINYVVGATGRKIDEKDIEKMSYLNAFVKELLRKHPPSYITITHSVTEHAKVAGYDIPMGAHVEIYLPGIGKNPNIWADPERFDPDRFIGGGGGENVDVMGVCGMKMIPFGAGRRICPGMEMGTLLVSLMIARMVQEFEWQSWPENSKVDFSEKLEFMVVMKKSLRAMIKPRV